ncbi:hypothetical protein ACOSP7_017675 [Xanthoceras sorbifolium]
MDKISSKTTFLVILLVAAFCLLVAEAEVFLRCKSNEECNEMKCEQGTAHCALNQCRCRQTILEDSYHCRYDDECQKKCPPHTIGNCVGGHCICTGNTISQDRYHCRYNDECKKLCPPNTTANCVGNQCICSGNA